jgi:hypothetical protein
LTGAFWADVRSVWRDSYSSRSGFTLAERVDDEALFQPMFEFAYELEQGTEYDPAAGRAFIRATLERYLD